MNSVSAPRTVLFIDLRHIRCGDLEWFSLEGNRLPLIPTSEPQVEAHAGTDFVPHGIRLVAQRANKTKPLPKGTFSGYSRIIFENGLYRAWYLDAKYPHPKAMPLSVEVCYVESKDGFEWTQPARGQIEVSGRKGFDGFTTFIDSKGPLDERYKAVYTATPPKEEWPSIWEKYQRVHPRYRDTRINADNVRCMYGVVSPDGIHWKSIPEPLMVHMSDTDTSIYYDAWLDRYVMYTRLYWQERRWIARAEAEDFRHWGPVQPLIWPRLDGPLSDDIYTNGRTEYPGLPQYHLMFPMIYHRYTQTSEVRLFSSADGICWNEVPGGPVLSPGALGEWDSEFISVGKDLVPLGNDRVGILYHGTSYPHKYPRWKGILEAGRTAWAWWPKARLCAVVADEEGEFYTFPLVPAGRELRLNVRTRHGGAVRVGLVGIPGRTADDCDLIIGDSLTMPVRWKGQFDIGVKEGESVTLHFKLRAAELFGFEWI